MENAEEHEEGPKTREMGNLERIAMGLRLETDLQKWHAGHPASPPDAITRSDEDFAAENKSGRQPFFDCTGGPLIAGERAEYPDDEPSGSGCPEQHIESAREVKEAVRDALDMLIRASSAGEITLERFREGVKAVERHIRNLDTPIDKQLLMGAAKNPYF